MAKVSKRIRALREKLDADKVYSIDEALSTLKEVSSVKFTESVEIAINLGIDARKSDQVVRGATTLPNGTGKEVRVAVFTQGPNEQAAKDAGADLVGMEDLAEQVKKGEIEFDVVIASPDAMPTVGKLGQILGPRGLMPNPKTGTVTPDVATAVKNAKAGQVRFRNDKAGIVSAAIGTRDFEVAALEENITALIADINKLKPASAKGQYLKKITVSTTMGPGLQVDVASVAQ
ncbi:MAG: 50S ribosomal protein L1 [Gammaproteobacteria bacterium]|nr:50S ribosomal protein L1 [Gammaproteobacteria bacterium]